MTLQLVPNYDLSKFTWLGVGGKADFFAEISDENSLISFLKNSQCPITILGAGSNVLIRDGGFYQMTRAQARSHVEVPFGEVLDVSECQDTVLYKPSKGLFGVFDGVGGSENGRGASRRAADVISQISESSDLASGSNLAWAINERNPPGLIARGMSFTLRSKKQH